MRLVDIDKFINDFPICLNHYDEENGSKKFVSGIEVVLDSLDCTQTVDAIPVEWIKKYIVDNTQRIDEVAGLTVNYYIYPQQIATMLKAWWEEENG